jgi:general secretion pathway protein E
MSQRSGVGVAADTLEDFMLDHGLITPAELGKAQQVCRETGERLVTTLRRLGIMSGTDLAQAVASHYGLPTVRDGDWPKASVLGDVLSTRYLREHKALPLSVDNRSLLLAVADPGHADVIGAIGLASGRAIEVCVAAAEDIDAALDRFQPADEAEVGEIPTAAEGDDDVEHLKDLALGAPVIRLVNQLLLDGLNARATDIHIEPFRGRLNIRFRIDGMLTEARSVPAHMARAVVSRVKILSGLDIAERRLPQDGRARVKIEARTIDLRIATMPTIHGEAVAIRLLENLQRVLDLSKLGFPAPEEALLRTHLAAPHGLILVTGPTGSGKTTTLAAALTILNEPHRKILTVEDPIEYQIEGVNQTQIKAEIGMTFANALRHLLRHDPDAIMVGEMRDTETAQIAVHAALTGHLVLSTLHTNSAAGAVSRLLDMGVDGYLLASCLSCVIGQRLVRVLCRSCREEFVAPLDFPGHVLQREGLTGDVVQWRPRGCDRCGGAGFLGRTTIVEVLAIDDETRRLMRPGVMVREVEEAAQRAGMSTMLVDGLRKCRAGITTADEVRRVTIEA